MNRRFQPRPTQSGNALIISIVLLLLLTVIVFFGANVGIQEQRTTGSDFRARLVQQTAEAGLALGAEYINANQALLDISGAEWEVCPADDETFPCGQAPDGRRSTMYRFIGGALDINGDAAVSTLEERALPIPQSITETAGFDVDLVVGALLCKVMVGATSADDPTCSTSAADESDTFTVTLVSRGELAGEDTKSTVAFTFGKYPNFGISPNTPPILASGTVSMGGGMQVVANANSGGTGVPISVWTRLNMAKSGTPNTCYIDEFIREGGTSDDPAYYYNDGADADIIICHTCKCPGSGSLSYPASGNKQCEGIDILDIDSNEANDACTDAPNKDVKRWEFPSDLFQFVFGVDAWSDAEQDMVDAAVAAAAAGEDPSTGAQATCQANSQCGFAETRLRNSDGIGLDTEYLRDSADIYIGDDEDDAAECAAIGPASSGLIFIESGSGCDISNLGKQIGSPRAPVLIVHDGSLVNFKATSGFYGMLFIRVPDSIDTLDPATGSATGAPVTLSTSGNTAIYGAVVIQGSLADGGGGTASIVFSADVLSNLNPPENQDPTGAVPGSWSDRTRY